jgi:hypothetical protein
MTDPLTSAYLPATPLDDAVRITAIETSIPLDILPGLMLLRIHTDAGTIGHGEACYIPRACAALIHDELNDELLTGGHLAAFGMLSAYRLLSYLD